MSIYKTLYDPESESGDDGPLWKLLIMAIAYPAAIVWIVRFVLSM